MHGADSPINSAPGEALQGEERPCLLGGEANGLLSPNHSPLTPVTTQLTSRQSNFYFYHFFRVGSYYWELFLAWVRKLKVDKWQMTLQKKSWLHMCGTPNCFFYRLWTLQVESPILIWWQWWAFANICQHSADAADDDDDESQIVTWPKKLSAGHCRAC